ncbi:NEW3 domain-containing protein [Chloroflexota bacterium]
MKMLRVICLLLVSLLAISPIGSVFAQEEEPPVPELISEEEASYELSLTPYDGHYNATIVAGRDRTIALNLENSGTAAIDNIVFTAEEPEDWEVGFDPEEVASLEAGESGRIDVTIEVPSTAVEGDYMVTLTASGTQASAKEVDFRVTVNVPIVEPKVEIRPIYPTLEAIAGGEFVFEVEFLYTSARISDEPVVFNLTTKVPQGWEIYMTPPYEKEKKLSAISLKPGFSFGDKTRVVVSPTFWPLPEPGEYEITLTADSGELQDTAEFTAIITAKYNLILIPTLERYNTTATAGKDNYFSIEAGNLGTAAIENISFSANKPQGWTVEFSPDKVDLLEALDSQTIDVNIKPPPETISGDYSITLKASGTQTTAMDLNVRVTVESPTIWGWVGIGIIVLVVAGLVVIFMRFSRR